MEQIGKTWFELWVESFLRAFSYVVGVEQLKLFAGKTAEAFTTLLEDHGVPAPKGNTIDQLASSCMANISELGAGKIEWQVEKNGDDITLKVGVCPFSRLSSSMLSEIIMSGRVDKQKAPCLISELVVGACRNAGIKCRSTLVTFIPGKQCVTEIKKLEV